MKPYRSPHLEAAVAEAPAAARAAGLSARAADALAREELKLCDRVGGVSGRREDDRYRSLRLFLEALCSRTA